jgi:hypothetical protein
MISNLTGILCGMSSLPAFRGGHAPITPLFEAANLHFFIERNTCKRKNNAPTSPANSYFLQGSL